MDEERNPRFSPSVLKPTPRAHRWLCFPDCRPTVPQQDNRMDGRTDGRTAQAPPGPVQGCRQGGQRGSGGQRWVPPAHGPAGDPFGRPRGGCLGILFFFLSLPVRLLAVGAALAGRTPMGVGKRWPPPGSGSVTSGARRCHHQPQHPQPCAPHPSQPPQQRGEEGAASGGDPTPAAPASPPAPASAVAPAPRSLSPPSQKQRDSLSFIFYLINFHFLHKTSNCKYF